ncbi:MAG: hypothetical protein WCQ50_01105 [Spirochaetota bacterium]
MNAFLGLPSKEQLTYFQQAMARISLSSASIENKDAPLSSALAVANNLIHTPKTLCL